MYALVDAVLYVASHDVLGDVLEIVEDDVRDADPKNVLFDALDDVRNHILDIDSNLIYIMLDFMI